MNFKKVMEEEYYKLRNFGLPVAVFDILATVTKHPVFYQRKHNSILYYLQKKYEPVLEKYCSISATDERITEDCPIWVFWYQGFETAPDLVKSCLKSLKRCAGKHPVMELSKNNYRDYVQIPDYIEKKWEAGWITVPQFSDILRVSLLAKYGGCWTDATIFYSSWIYERLDTAQWYSIKPKMKIKNPMYVSEYRWSAYFQICSKNNIIMRYMQEMFYSYWKDHSQMIDYFLIDYLFALGYQHILEIRKLINDTPYNNSEINWMGAHLDDKYDDKEYSRIIEKTALFKLNWRAKVSADKDTYYSKIILSKGEDT